MLRLDKVILGFPVGRYSCSGQSLPYVIYHIPTLTCNADCAFIVSCMQGGKIRSRNIGLSDLPVRANQRTCLSLVIMYEIGNTFGLSCFKNLYLCKDEEVLADIEELSGKSGYLSLAGFDYCIV